MIKDKRPSGGNKYIYINKVNQRNSVTTKVGR